MESLYDVLIEYYDELFPVDPERLSFISDLAKKKESGISENLDRIKVLDIGCANGSFALALMRQNMDVTGIDSNASMIQSACRRNPEPRTNARFFRMDMLDTGKNMAQACFDLILCLGNTLTRLDSSKSVLSFLRQVYALLQVGGCLVIQIINFKKLSDEAHFRLPIIESTRARFERNYYKRTDERLDFESIIYSSSGKAVFRERLPVLPILPLETVELLRNVGFTAIDLFDDFSGEKLKTDSETVVVVAYR